METEDVLPSMSSQPPELVLTSPNTAVEQSADVLLVDSDCIYSQADLWSEYIALLTRHHVQFGSTNSGLKTMVRHLKDIQSATQWESYLHTGASGATLA